MLRTRNSGLTVFMCGLVVMLISTTVLFGWFFDLPLLVRVRSYWAPMVVNTAICCWLGGFVLVSSYLFKHEVALDLQKVIGGIILIIASLVMIETIFGVDLYIDSAELHRPLQPEYTNPGRMAPNSALALIMFGLYLLAHGFKWAVDGKRRIVTQLLAGGVLILGWTGIFGYLLNIEYLYSWTGSVRMSIPTAVCIVFLGFALFNLSFVAKQQKNKIEDADVSRIYHISAFVITLVCLTAGAAGFSIMAQQVEDMIKNNLLQVTKDRLSLFNVSLTARSERAVIAARVPNFVMLLSQLNKNPDNRPAQQSLARFAKPMAENGFSAIALEGLNGHLWQALGELSRESKLAVEFHGAYSGSLLWDSGYLLHSRIPIHDKAGNPVGFMVAEQALKRLDNLREQTLELGTTSDIEVCSSVGDYLSCFPSKIEAQPFKVAKFYQKQRLPMSYALDFKQTGIKTALDYRGQRVLAAYGPIADTGLGMVIKIDTAEIYAPIKQQLQKAVIIVLGLLVLGLWLIRRRLLPLVKNIDNARTQAEREQARFIAASEGGLDAFFIYDAVRDAQNEMIDFRCTFINEKGSKMFSMAPGGFVGKLMCEELPFTRSPMYFDQFKQVVETGKPVYDELQIGESSIHAKWLARQVVKLGDGIAITARDITEQRRMQDTLREAERIQHAIFDSASYSIIATDSKGTIISMNKAAQRMLGYDEAELVGKFTPEVIHDKDEVISYAKELSEELGRNITPGFETFIAKAAGNVSDEREWTYIRKDGSRFPVKLSVTELRDVSNQTCGYLGVAYDITKQKNEQEYITYLATHDGLTGLPNRTLFNDRMRVAMERAKRDKTQLAVALIDLDYFKKVNDTLGHHVGDIFLQETALRLGEHIRPSDTLARLGGDEFALLLPNTSHPDGSTILLNKIYKALQQPIMVAGHEFHVSISVGVCAYPSDGTDPSMLMRYADEAMYNAKAAGRNNFQIYKA